MDGEDRSGDAELDPLFSCPQIPSVLTTQSAYEAEAVVSVGRGNLPAPTVGLSRPSPAAPPVAPVQGGMGGGRPREAVGRPGQAAPQATADQRPLACVSWKRPLPAKEKDEQIWIQPEGPKHLSPLLSNLRDVYLYNVFYDCDLNWTMFVLEAAPSLKNFYLMLSRHPCERAKREDGAKRVNVHWDQLSPDLKHHRLSLLEIVGFAVDEKLVKYIRLVMDRAVGLKRIRLRDQAPCAECNAMDDTQSASLIRRRFPVEEDDTEKAATCSWLLLTGR